LGLDPLPVFIENYDIKTLATSIESVDKNWQAGRFPDVTKVGGDKVSAADSNVVAKQDAKDQPWWCLTCL